MAGEWVVHTSYGPSTDCMVDLRYGFDRYDMEQTASHCYTIIENNYFKSFEIQEKTHNNKLLSRTLTLYLTENRSSLAPKSSSQITPLPSIDILNDELSNAKLDVFSLKDMAELKKEFDCSNLETFIILLAVLNKLHPFSDFVREKMTYFFENDIKIKKASKETTEMATLSTFFSKLNIDNKNYSSADQILDTIDQLSKLDIKSESQNTP